MATLLEKIGGTRKNENRQENCRQSEGRSGGARCETKANPEIGIESPGSARSPCPDCGSLLAWIDVYGAGPHCFRCRPYTSERLVRTLLVAHNGRWLTLSEAREAERQLPGLDASCPHRRVSKLVTGIPGDILADQQTYFECRDCGLWLTAAELVAERAEAEQSAL